MLSFRKRHIHNILIRQILVEQEEYYIYKWEWKSCYRGYLAQFAATLVPFVPKCYCWQRLMQLSDSSSKQGGLQLSFLPTNFTRWNTQRRCHTIAQLGNPLPNRSAIPGWTEERDPKGGGEISKVLPLSLLCVLSRSPLSAHIHWLMWLVQFGIAGEWLKWRPCEEGQALAAIKFTCLRYQVPCLMSCTTV